MYRYRVCLLLCVFLMASGCSDGGDPTPADGDGDTGDVSESEGDMDPDNDEPPDGDPDTIESDITDSDTDTGDGEDNIVMPETDEEAPESAEDDDETGGGLVRRQGDGLAGPDGRPLVLRGIGFGNNVWIDSMDPRDHHDAQEYRSVADMGFNAVRFYLNYHTFETDDAPGVYLEEGWQWMDANIAWARETGIYLIPNMHVPQGGFQSMGEGAALWDNPDNQDRLVALWQAFAARYKDEPVIAGWDVLNEPKTTQSRQQWEDLCNRIIAAMRNEGDDHLMIVEPLNGIIGQEEISNDPAAIEFLVPDDNVMYDIHFYLPAEYTMQGIDVWGVYDTGPYPDPGVVYLSDGADASGVYMDNPRVPGGGTALTWYEGVPMTVTDATVAGLLPGVLCYNLMGQVLADDFVMEEFDGQGTLVDTRRIDVVTPGGWLPFKDNESLTMDTTGTPDSDGFRLTFTGGGGNAMGVWTNIYRRYRATPGHRYRVSGYLEGVNVGVGSQCMFTLLSAVEPDHGPALVRDKEYLRHELGRYLAFMQQNNVPVYVGEYGAGRSCFGNDLGGLQWVTDMLDLFEEFGVDAHSYHQLYGGYFGFAVSRGQPGTMNRDLVDLFTARFSGQQ